MTANQWAMPIDGVRGICLDGGMDIDFSRADLDELIEWSGYAKRAVEASPHNNIPMTSGPHATVKAANLDRIEKIVEKLREARRVAKLNATPGAA